MPRGINSRKQYTEEFKRSAVQRAETETIQIVADSLGIQPSMIYYWRDKFRGDIGKPSANNSDRIYWTNDEVKLLSETWLKLRLEFPFHSATELLEKAQRKCLPGDRQRTFLSIQTNKPCMAEITRLCSAAILKLEAVAEAERPPEVQILTLEVPRKLTAAEMIESLDEPTLEALLCSKRLIRETRFHEIMARLAGQAGATGLPKVTQFIPRLEAFDAGQHRVQRIAIVGLPSNQHDEVTREKVSAGLDAELRFPAAKDSLTIERCDYAIICRGQGKTNGDLNSVGDRTIGKLGRSRVVLVDDTNTTHLIQQIRNLITRQ